MKSPRKRKPKLGVCGTQDGYEHHLRKQEHPCRYCLVGSLTYTHAEIRQLFKRLRDRDREQLLWSKYKISLKTYERILQEQGQCCACCGAKQSQETWNIDHDRDTNEVRGILCSNCNAGIGMLGDTVDGVQRAVSYLLKHAERGGHSRDDQPPPQRSAMAPPSDRMLKCFVHFDGGASIADVVIKSKLPPEVVQEIHAQWLRGVDRALQQFNSSAPRLSHLFQTPKDNPRRCACSCGFSVLCEDPSDVARAVMIVSAHVESHTTPPIELKFIPDPLDAECFPLFDQGKRVPQLLKQFHRRADGRMLAASYLRWCDQPGNRSAKKS